MYIVRLFIEGRLILETFTPFLNFRYIKYTHKEEESKSIKGCFLNTKDKLSVTGQKIIYDERFYHVFE